MIRHGRLLRTGVAPVGLTMGASVAVPGAALAQMGPDYRQVHGLASNAATATP